MDEKQLLAEHTGHAAYLHKNYSRVMAQITQ